MPRNAAHGPRVLVVDFSPYQALAIGGVLLGWRNLAAQAARRVECRMLHSQRRENFLLCECIERLAGKALYDFAKKNESEIRIFDLRARLTDERFGDNAREHCVMALGVLVKITMARKPRIVEQQHANRYLGAPRWIGIRFRSRRKFGHIIRDGRIDIETVLLDEDHQRRRCDDRLRQRRDIIDRVDRGLASLATGSELAERMQGELSI